MTKTQRTNRRFFFFFCLDVWSVVVSILFELILHLLQHEHSQTILWKGFKSTEAKCQLWNFLIQFLLAPETFYDVAQLSQTWQLSFSWAGNVSICYAKARWPLFASAFQLEKGKVRILCQRLSPSNPQVRVRAAQMHQQGPGEQAMIPRAYLLPII